MQTTADLMDIPAADLGNRGVPAEPVGLPIAISLVLSAIQARYHDIGVAMALLLQPWMFATPVVYPHNVVPTKWRTLYDLNPMVAVIESFRRVMLLGGLPEVHTDRGGHDLDRPAANRIRLVQTRRSHGGRRHLTRKTAA